MIPSDGWVKEPQVRWGGPAPCGTARALGSASPLTRLTLRMRSRFPPASLRFRDHDRLVHLRGGGREVKQLVLASRDLDEVFEVGASRRGRQCHGPDASGHVGQGNRGESRALFPQLAPGEDTPWGLGAED